MLISNRILLQYSKFFLFFLILIIIIPASLNKNFWDKYRYNEYGQGIDGVEGPTGVAVIKWHENNSKNTLADIKINGLINSSLPNSPKHVELQTIGLSVKERSDVLILGIGGGGMIKEFEQDYNSKNITLVDWSQEIVKVLSKPRASQLLDNLLYKEKVNLFSGDARQFVRLSKAKSYNLIVDNLAYTYFAGSTSVKSITYYNEISRLLKKNGVFILKINGRDSYAKQAVISGVVKSFKSVYFYDGILLASNTSLECFFNKKFNNLVSNCPLIKNNFKDTFLYYKSQLNNNLQILDHESYLDNFQEAKFDEYNQIDHIKDSYPKYEYFLKI